MKKHNFNNTFKCLMSVGIFALGICLIIALTNDDDNIQNIPAEAPSIAQPAPTPWSFGVMGDTQWTFDLDDPEGTNPETVAGSFITQVNQEFINHGVKFVIQVGDLTNYGYVAAIEARATLAQALYDAGIGFFPMRGNHEPWGNIYPPNPGVDNGYSIPAIQEHFPQTQGMGDNLFGAENFSSPTSTDPALPNLTTELAGISYAFDYGDEEGNDATFVIMDPWETDSASEALFSKDYGPWGIVPYPYGYRISHQQAWISERLDLTARGTEHAFVFSHQPLIATNHEDSPFGFLDEQTDDQNTFYADLVNNDIAFYMGGHDHVHERAMVESPDGLSSVEQIICAPQCPKFYAPNYDAPEWRGQKYRRTVIETEYDNPGYYIFTVEGPIVTAEYYSDSTGGWVAGRSTWPGDDPSLSTPQFNYVLKDTFRFSLNGQAFMVPQGGDYSVVSDAYNGTSVSLMGTNTSTSVECATCADVTSNTMPLTKRVTTAWKDMENGLVSSVLMLDGMNETGAARTEPYVLTMTDPSTGPTARIVAKTGSGEWVDAAGLTGGVPGSTSGPASPSHSVGTYGMDSATNTVWAVLDYDGTFAIKIN